MLMDVGQLRILAMVASSLKTLANAWCVGHRFQLARGPCVLCRRPESDHLGHVAAECETVLAFWAKHSL